jgi:NADH-ubiquinone oxidoreductase chain 2
MLRGITAPIHKMIEYPLIILFILVGSIALISSSDYLTMFLAIELQSYGLYILVALHRNSE